MKNLWWGLLTLMLAGAAGLGIYYEVNKDMINYYNKGNEYCEEDQYDKAQVLYQEALKGKLSDEQDCMARINMALAMTAPLTEDYVTDENRGQVIDTLKQAREILLQNGCAGEEEEGHNEQAQILKEEIDSYIEQLEKEEEEPEEEPTEEPTEEDPQPEDPTQDENWEEMIESMYEEIQEQGMQERGNELEELNSNVHYEYYSGKSW